MILSFAEHNDGVPVDASLEAITTGRALAEEVGCELNVALICPSENIQADVLGAYGVSTIYSLWDDTLTPYAPEAWANALNQLVDTEEPEVVLGGGSERTQELLARLGAQRDIPFAANCNDISPGEPYQVIRQRWGGSLLAECQVEGSPVLLSTTPHEHAAEQSPNPSEPVVESVDIDIGAVDIRVQLSRVEEADIEGIPLGEARVVVGGGRGVGSGENFDILEELADALGGTVGASRAAVNEGWRPHDDQIGLTGAKISPELYIACGISGAVQHWVGAKGAEHVLAINTDPEAAIIQKSDWAVIGDLHDVIPAITAAME